jgi:hypothetical protein
VGLSQKSGRFDVESHLLSTLAGGTLCKDYLCFRFCPNELVKDGFLNRAAGRDRTAERRPTLLRANVFATIAVGSPEQRSAEVNGCCHQVALHQRVCPQNPEWILLKTLSLLQQKDGETATGVYVVGDPLVGMLCVRDPLRLLIDATPSAIWNLANDVIDDCMGAVIDASCERAAISFRTNWAIRSDERSSSFSVLAPVMKP